MYEFVYCCALAQRTFFHVCSHKKVGMDIIGKSIIQEVYCINCIFFSI